MFSTTLLQARRQTGRHSGSQQGENHAAVQPSRHVGKQTSGRKAGRQPAAHSPQPAARLEGRHKCSLAAKQDGMQTDNRQEGSQADRDRKAGGKTANQSSRQVGRQTTCRKAARHQAAMRPSRQEGLGVGRQAERQTD